MLRCEIMKLICWILCIACCSFTANTYKNDQEPDMNEDLQNFIRKLREQQMHTARNMHVTLPRLNLPLLGPQREERSEERESLLPLLKIPFQSNFGREGAHSYAASSASIKRPYTGELDAKAVAYASVKDVNEEETLGEAMDSSDKSSTVIDHFKKTTSAESTDGNTALKTGPYTSKQQQVETVVKAENSFSDVYFVAIVAGCCAAGIFGVVSAGFCFYRLQKSRKAAADVDYPAYGVTGPCKDVSSPNGDRKLAQSAQMYHYQHQKQQMIAVEKAGSTKNTSASDVDSEEENEEGDYTVYECPGLAPTGEMEVKNPLFHDDSTPVSPPVLPAKSNSNQNN